MTPNNRAPPEATKPGNTVIELHGRLPSRATNPGPTASTATPRRIGTARQTEPRSVRIRAVRSEYGARRATNVPVSTCSSSRGIRRIARCAGTAPSTTAASSSPISTVTVSTQRWPTSLTMATTSCWVGIWSKTDNRLPESWSPSAAPSTPTTRARMPTMPCGTRRAPSSPQATACETAVAVAIHSSTITWADARVSCGPSP